MRTQSKDTHPKAEKVLISLLRDANTAKKFSQIRSLSQVTLQLSRRALVRANKDLTEQQIDVLFVFHHYGKELSDNLEKYFDSQAHENS